MSSYLYYRYSILKLANKVCPKKAQVLQKSVDNIIKTGKVGLSEPGIRYFKDMIKENGFRFALPSWAFYLFKKCEPKICPHQFLFLA